jgi:hypothetical protein
MVNSIFNVTVIENKEGIDTICHRKCRLFDSESAKQDAQDYFESIMNEVRDSNVDQKDFSTKVVIEQIW